MKSNGINNSKLKPLYTASVHSINLSGYKIGIKLDKYQNNYLIKIVNVYIVFELAAWPKNPTDNFKFKNCLFGATNIVIQSDKEKYLYGL